MGGVGTLLAITHTSLSSGCFEALSRETMCRVTRNDAQRPSYIHDYHGTCTRVYYMYLLHVLREWKL